MARGAPGFSGESGVFRGVRGVPGGSGGLRGVPGGSGGSHGCSHDNLPVTVFAVPV